MILYLLNGPQEGTSLTLKADTVLGREPGPGGLALPWDSGISSRHARIVGHGVDWVIIDLKSKHGTQVDLAPITGPTPLRAGQVITLAKTLLLVGNDDDGLPPFLLAAQTTTGARS